MPPRRSDSVGTYAVLNIIFGCLMILCGVQALDHSDKIEVNHQDVTQQWIEFMNSEVPGYSICRTALPILGLIVAVGFVVSGVGLQMRKNWGRISALAIGALAIAYEMFQAVYQIFFINPALKKPFAGAPINIGGFFASLVTFIVLFGALFIGGYSIILIVGMLQPGTIRALGGGEDEDEDEDFEDDDEDDYPRRRRARRDYDEEDEEEDLPPRRTKRRLQREEEDEEDEEDEAPPRPRRSVRREEIQEDPPRPKPRRAPRPKDEE